MSKLTDFDRGGDPFMGAFDRKPTGLTDWPPHMEQYHWSSFESKQEREEAKNRLYRDTLNNVAFRTYNPAWQDAEHELRRINLEMQAAHLTELQRRETQDQLNFYGKFHYTVLDALNKADPDWRYNDYGRVCLDDGEMVAQCIRWLFDANKDIKRQYEAMRESREHYRNELENEKQRRRPFKRLFEFFRIGGREPQGHER